MKMETSTLQLCKNNVQIINSFLNHNRRLVYFPLIYMKCCSKGTPTNINFQMIIEEQECKIRNKTPFMFINKQLVIITIMYNNVE